MSCFIISYYIYSKQVSMRKKMMRLHQLKLRVLRQLRIRKRKAKDGRNLLMLEAWCSSQRKVNEPLFFVLSVDNINPENIYTRLPLGIHYIRILG